jgi:hypothetical protein
MRSIDEVICLETEPGEYTEDIIFDDFLAIDRQTINLQIR